MSAPSVADLVARLDLKPHPEGGFYRETYRSPGVVPRAALGPAFGGDRAHATAILFLLPAGAKSRLHRIKSDELWHFHLGGPLTVASISPSGAVSETILGPDLSAGHQLQHAVPAGSWFGAYPGLGAAFSLVGCTVSPGFDFADFELGRRDELLREFPRARGLIERLTN